VIREADWLIELGLELAGPVSVRQVGGGLGEGGVQLALVGREGGEVVGDGAPVASGDGSGEGGSRAEGGGVVETALCESHEGLERDAAGSSESLDLAKEGDEMVGGNDCGGVIEGTRLIGDRKRRSAQGLGDLVGANTGDGHPCTYESLGADLSVGERDQWVERADLAMGRERIECERAGQMNDGAGFDWLDSLGRGRHNRIGGSEDDDIHTVGGSGEVVISMEITNGPADAFESETKRTASTSLTNDADLHHTLKGRALCPLQYHELIPERTKKALRRAAATATGATGGLTGP
jgi:hypothetical protein